MTELARNQLKIAGMDCADCALKLEKGVARLDGVHRADVNFATATMWVQYDAETVAPQDIVRRIRTLGYDVDANAGTRRSPAAASQRSRWETLLTYLGSHPRDLATLGSGLLLGLAVFAGFLGWVTVSTVLYVSATVVGGALVARKGLSNLWINRELDINFLMMLAGAGALLIGEVQEAALVIFLFSLGETLEAYTLDQARHSIHSLMSLVPPTATRLSGCIDCAEHLGQDGYTGGICPFCTLHETRVAVDDLLVGDILVVRAGERFPMDGLVTAGESSVNQAPITGESLPVDKIPGSEVFAGSVNGGGTLEIRVTRLAADNTISRMITLVEEAQAQKAPTQRWVDRFACVYTPAVVTFAALLAFIPPLVFGQPFWNLPDGQHGWLYRALTMLVIACPCALVISTPVSIVSALTHAARRGILVKGGVHLEAASQLRAVAFDKTGTLTVGKPHVTDIIVNPATGEDSASLLSTAAAIESRSTHPLAQAIVTEAVVQGVAVIPARQVQVVSGRGAQAQVNGETVLVGNSALFRDRSIDLPPVLVAALAGLEAEGKTVMLVGREGARPTILGLVAVADTIRPAARSAVAGLRDVGVAHTVLLSGDNERTAQAVAQQAGVAAVRANLQPADKVAAIEALLQQYGAVAMVGDGINDAPALARATVGIAMGGIGTDQALETADVVLMADDLHQVAYTIALSQRTRRIVMQNIVLSLGIKAVFMALALVGAATLWMAVFADMGASLLVILNGMRLLRR